MPKGGFEDRRQIALRRFPALRHDVGTDSGRLERHQARISSFSLELSGVRTFRLTCTVRELPMDHHLFVELDLGRACSPEPDHEEGGPVLLLHCLLGFGNSPQPRGAGSASSGRVSVPAAGHLFGIVNEAFEAATCKAEGADAPEGRQGPRARAKELSS